MSSGMVSSSVSVTFVWVIILSLIFVYRMFTVLAHLLKASYSILGYGWNVLFSSCFGFLERFRERSRGALIGFSPYLLGLLQEMSLPFLRLLEYLVLSEYTHDFLKSRKPHVVFHFALFKTTWLIETRSIPTRHPRIHGVLQLLSCSIFHPKPFVILTHPLCVLPSPPLDDIAVGHEGDGNEPYAADLPLGCCVYMRVSRSYLDMWRDAENEVVFEDRG